MPRRGLVGFKDLLPPPDAPPADPVKTEVARTIQSLREQAELRTATSALREVIHPDAERPAADPSLEKTAQIMSQVTEVLGNQVRTLTERVGSTEDRQWAAYDRGYQHADELVKVLRETLERQYEAQATRLTEQAKDALGRVTKAYDELVEALKRQADQARTEMEKLRNAPPTLEHELGTKLLQPLVTRLSNEVESLVQLSGRPAAREEDPRRAFQKEWMDLQLDMLAAKVKKAIRETEQDDGTMSREDVKSLADRALSLAERVYTMWSGRRAEASGLSDTPPPPPDPLPFEPAASESAAPPEAGVVIDDGR